MAGISVASPSTGASLTSAEDAFAAAAAPEIVLFNGITIHDSGTEAIEAFTKIIDEYASIWTDQGFAELLKENWMRISLKSD